MPHVEVTNFSQKDKNCECARDKPDNESEAEIALKKLSIISNLSLDFQLLPFEKPAAHLADLLMLSSQNPKDS